ncbi:MAG: hypothetical protein PHD43_21310 [Methylococcales bacterium]|nr:hypothetical protein [Methylococcales bacterium]
MQKTYSRLNTKIISGAATLITMLIIVTPLCGLLFQCGCDWPWSGLDAECNFYKPGADHQCPWCAPIITGIFSTGLAIISSVLTAMAPSLPLAIVRPVNEVAVRILLGLMVFALVSILTAGLAALSQNYQLGVGSFLT